MKRLFFIFAFVTSVAASAQDFLTYEYTLDGSFTYAQGDYQEDYDALAPGGYHHKFCGMAINGTMVTETVYNVDGTLDSQKSHTLPAYSGYELQTYQRYSFGGQAFCLADYRMKSTSNLASYYKNLSKVVLLDEYDNVIMEVGTAFSCFLNPYIIFDGDVCRMYVSVTEATYSSSSVKYNYKTKVYRLNKLSVGVDDVESKSESRAPRFFRLNGIGTPNPTPGVNIVTLQDANGHIQARKMLYK